MGVDDGVRPDRILLVGYHFGPRGGTGAHRWNAMAAHLAAWGWSVDVLTAFASEGEPPVGDARRPDAPGTIRTIHLPAPIWPRAVLDGALAARSRVARALGGIRPPASDGVRRDPACDGRGSPLRPAPGSARRWNSFLRLAADLAWSWSAVRVGRRLAEAYCYRAVVVSTPPHAAQLVGPVLSRDLGIPYVADYRDPWDFGLRWRGNSVHPAQRLLARLCERWTMEHAWRIVCNTERAAMAVKRAHPSAGPAVVAIPNGYDALRDVARPEPERFRVVYAGHLYPWHDLRVLLSACARFLRRTGLHEAEFRVELIGVDPDHHGVPIVDLARMVGLERCLAIHPPATRQEAMRLQQTAALHVVFDHFHGLAVPAKFYDCVQMYGTLLLLGDPHGALAEAGRRIGVTVHDSEDRQGIDAVFDAAFDRWLRGAFDRRADGAGIFDRRHQSRRMRSLMESVVGGPAGRLAVRECPAPVRQG